MLTYIMYVETHSGSFSAFRETSHGAIYLTYVYFEHLAPSAKCSPPNNRVHARARVRPTAPLASSFNAAYSPSLTRFLRSFSYVLVCSIQLSYPDERCN